jgi:hypothetical protein
MRSIDAIPNDLVPYAVDIKATFDASAASGAMTRTMYELGPKA